MASANDRVCIHNWRILCHGKHNRGNNHGSIYRSSRPDLMDPVDLEEFKKHGIKCIIDLRSAKDYEIATGSKVLDNYYKLYKVVLPLKANKYKLDEAVICEAIQTKNAKQAKVAAADITEKKHFLINFFNPHYIRAIFRRAPWYIQIISLFIAIYDFIFKTAFKNFVRLFAVTVINKEGLAAQYLDIVDMSKSGLCAGLKLLTDKNNIPAMINCAHGKDRTGILSALVLSVLGETDENIVKDYALSQEGLLPIRDRVFKEIVEHYYWDKSFCDANPENMRNLLQYLNKTYGSVKDYLVSIGFSEEQQEQLRANLLEN